MSKQDIVIRIGGEGGEGVISAGEILSRAAARSQFHFFTFRTYPAEIKGGLAMFQLRISRRQVLSHGSALDVLMCFNQEAFDNYWKELKPDGIVLYDPKYFTPPKAFKNKSIPLELEQISLDSSGTTRGKNIVAVGAIGEMIGIPYDTSAKLVEEIFLRKGEKVVLSNQKALKGACEYSKKAIQKIDLGEPEMSQDEHWLILSGNEALALGAISAGCRFCTGYPITPASSVLEFMARELPGFGGTVIQCEDEISAIGACLGASFAGAKAMTPTSGPGLALMTEMLNLAFMSETPIVVVDVQRSGPSTGMPTKTEQGDLRYALYGSPGECPRVVIAPASVRDCFFEMIRAFNIAEKYQVAVLVLSDQTLANRTTTVKRFDLNKIHIDNRIQPSDEDLKNDIYARYKLTDTGVSPMLIPGDPRGAFIATGLEHDEYCTPGYTPELHSTMTLKRFKKLDTLSADLENGGSQNGHYFMDIPKGAKIGIIAWGATFGPIREALEMAKETGVEIAHLHPKVLWPLPDKQIKEFISSVDKVIIPEENYLGHLSEVIKANYDVKPIQINKFEGIPFTPEELFQNIMEVG
ncbi:MAG: 2-oxoacid:acceptor oxidoreductase subunit alpha [Thermodesulfobacteriota bacterium]